MKYLLLLLFCCNAALDFAQEPKLMLPIGHTASVNYAEFSPDGTRIVTASNDNMAKIWDATSGILLANLIGHTSFVYTACFSQDGNKIATASEDGTIKIWDANSGLLIGNLTGNSFVFYSAKFSPDGGKVVAASPNYTVPIWDVLSGKQILSLQGHSGAVYFAEFSPDGKKIITASGDSTAKIWDAVSGQLLVTLRGHRSYLYSAHFSPDAEKVVTASHDNTAKIWDAVSGLLLFDLRGHTSYVNSADFSPDGKKVITGAFDNTAKIWNAVTGLLLNNLRGHTSYIVSAQFSPDGKRIVTISDSIAKIWDASTGLLLSNLKGHKSCINWAQFSPDSKKVVTAPCHNTAKIWSVSGINLVSLQGHSGAVYSAEFSPDSKKIITASGDSTAKIWDAVSGQLLLTLREHRSYLYSAHFSPDGGKIITKSRDTAVKLWDAISGKLLKDWKLPMNGVLSLQVSPDSKNIAALLDYDTIGLYDIDNGLSPHLADGKKILISSWAGTAKVVDANSGSLLAELKVNAINSAQFSPDGKKILTASGLPFRKMKDQDFAKVGTAKIWDAESGLLLKSLVDSSYCVNSASFSLDGKMILIVSDDDTLKVFDSETGAVMTNFRENNSAIISAQFSPDQKRILTAHEDKTCKLWNIETGKLLYTFFAVDSSDYLVVDKDGRYDGSEAARKLLYFTCGTEVISLDQVKDQLWVPNLAERIMRGETINAPKLSDLNICGLTPVVALRSDSGKFTITPRGGGLGETALYVNGIEVKRYKPEELNKSSKGYDLTIKPDSLRSYFVEGKENEISVKAFTAENNISSRGAHVIQTDSLNKAVHPNLYAVMVGVSDYKGDALDLKYAAKDANDLSNVVGSSAKELLGSEHVFMYNITTAEGRAAFPEKKTIQQVFEGIGKKATASDILLIFFAGHGVMASEADKKQFYFLTADASTLASADAVTTVGISTNELTEWIKPQNIKAQKRILIFDACNSGQAINDLVKIGDSSQNYLAVRNDDNSQQIKAIDKLNERSGMNILCASASDQSAYEMGRYSQGLLTYCLLKAIKEQPDILDDGKYLNVDKWFVAAKKGVEDIINQYGNRQQPQKFGTGDFYVGEVDNNVISQIKLPEEKALFTASFFNNKDESVGGDDLDLSNLLNQQLQDFSSRGVESNIDFIANSNAPDAYSLKGSYEVSGDTINVSVNIWQNKKNIYRYQMKGNENKIEELTGEIVKEAEGWVKKQK